LIFNIYQKYECNAEYKIYHIQPWAPAGFFQEVVQTSASEGLNGISVYLWNSNICYRISLCRKETDGVSVSDSVHE